MNSSFDFWHIYKNVYRELLHEVVEGFANVALAHHLQVEVRDQTGRHLPKKKSYS